MPPRKETPSESMQYRSDGRLATDTERAEYQARIREEAGKGEPREVRSLIDATATIQAAYIKDDTVDLTIVVSGQIIRPDATVTITRQVVHGSVKATVERDDSP